MFKNDKYDGKGTLEFANGTVYKGEFKDGKLNGVGTLFTAATDGRIDSNGGSKIKAIFKDDEIIEHLDS